MKDMVQLTEDLVVFQLSFRQAQTMDDMEQLSTTLDDLVDEMCKHMGICPKILRYAKRRLKQVY